MKHFLSALAVIAIAFPSVAQEQSSPVNKSVFSGSHTIITSSKRQTVQQLQSQFPAWGGSIDKISGNFNDIYGPAVTIPGNTIAEKVQYCLNTKLVPLSIVPAQWQMASMPEAPNAYHAHFNQSINGHKVAFARISFRFTKDGKLVRAQMKHYGQPDMNLVPVISTDDAKSAATADLGTASITQTDVMDWVWFPIPGSNGYTLHPAWEVIVKGALESKLPMELHTYIDAITGAILYRDNKVVETVDMTVKGNVYTQNPLLPATDEPLANLLVVAGSTNYYTNANGVFTSAVALNPPLNTTVKLQGKYSVVRASDQGNATPSFTNNITSNGTVYMFPTTGISTLRHVNAYYHVNRVHDFMKSYFPSFTSMDIALQTNVDLTSGNCNAFYNGSSINFYKASGTCNSFAICGDIIYHEYGHGISDKFYDDQGAGTIVNGALNEGCSDIWGIGITHNPVLGAGAYTTSSAYIRRYDQAPKVYPTDIVGEVHGDGEIIAGAWWDVSVNMGSIPDMTELFTLTYYDVPDGPNGTEGTVYHEVLISALQNDDDDNNLNNGTPHFAQIVNAFAKHGIYLLADAALIHTEINNKNTGDATTVNADLIIATPAFFQDLKLYYRKRGSAYDSVVMTHTTGNTYTAQIPGQTAGSIVDYYFSVNDFLAIPNVYFPVGYSASVSSTQRTIPYQFGIGLQSKLTNNFENDEAGWKIGGNTGDNATGGIWIRDEPVGSFVNGASAQLICQTDNDHTSGTGKCLITGNAPATSSPAGTADVDNGKTTVITPVFDLSSFTTAVIEYYRWFSNDRGGNPRNDAWAAEIRDSNSNFWLKVDETIQSDYNWRRRIFAVKEYLSTSKYVQMRFTASDNVVSTLTNNGQSTVEAGVDDFVLYDAAAFASVKNISSERARIFPNPADNNISVVLPSENREGNISLYDMTGRILYRTAIDGSTNYNIPVDQFAAGQYFVIIQSGKFIQSTKVQVAH